MADNVKVKIEERNGVELDFAEEYELVAENIPYDPSDSLLTSTDVKAALDETSQNLATSASPGFSWGRSGNLSSGTWLNNESVPSNRAGRSVTFNHAKIVRIYSANEDLDTYTLSVYEHEGSEINLTLLTTLSITASRTGDSGPIDVPVTTNRQLAIRVTAGSVKNIIVGINLSGDNT